MQLRCLSWAGSWRDSFLQLYGILTLTLAVVDDAIRILSSSYYLQSTVVLFRMYRGENYLAVNMTSTVV